MLNMDTSRTLGYLLVLYCTNFTFVLCVEEEICRRDSFEPICPQGSTILINSARFGRMKHGKCISEGMVGCTENVQGYIDSECFGQSSCSIFVPDRQLLTANPCSKDQVVHLEVSYECIQGNIISIIASIE